VGFDETNTSKRAPPATGGAPGRRRGPFLLPLAVALAIGCAPPPRAPGVDAGRAGAPAFAPVHVQLGGWGPGSRVIGAGIDCAFGGGTCATEVEEHGSLVLTALPGVGAAVEGWTGCVPSHANAETCTVTVGARGARGGRAVGVEFGLPAPTPPPSRSGVALTVVGSGWGTVTGGGLSCSLGTQGACNAELPEGGAVVLIATPGPNSWPAGWRGCAASPDGRSCTLAISGVARVEASFDNGSGGGPFSPTQRLTATARGSRPGNRISGGAIDCTSGAASSTCTADVATGEVVTLRAVAGPGSAFVRWNGCASVEGSACTVTLSKPTWVAAEFEP